jgi:YD repeat-containing protein
MTTAPGVSIGSLAISAICGEGNSTGLLAGTDNFCYCPIGRDWSDRRQMCVYILDRYHFRDRPEQCSSNNPPIGNPIYPLSGTKRQVQSLGFTIGRIGAAVVFDSLPTLANFGGQNYGSRPPEFEHKPPPGLPGMWTLNLHRRLASKYAHSQHAYRGASRWVSFTAVGGVFAADANISDRLFPSSQGWSYVDKDAGAVENYNGSGQLAGISYNDGTWLNYTYSTAETPASRAPQSGLLIGIQDDKGRSVALTYDSGSRISQVTTPAGQTIRFSYDANNNLSQLLWPDGSRRTFLYGRADLKWALTGVVSENNTRQSRFTYDGDGLAIGSTRVAAPGLEVDTVGVIYGANKPQWTVVETDDPERPGFVFRDHYFSAASAATVTRANGSVTTLGGTSILGSPYLTSQSQPAGSGCAASTSAQTFDAIGNLTSRIDFNGTKTCYAHLLPRNLESTRVEGLPAASPCTVTSSATLPTGARKISTEWHRDWPLKARIAEPGRRTTFVYNGQLDPVHGDLVSCAANTGTLPDGTPVTVLCRQIEQATDDPIGALGFAAPLSASTPVRQQRWTYNVYGQVLTHDGPRTDVADITTHEYHTSTSFSSTDPNAVGHTIGDLKQTTGPTGLVTRYPLYNRAGQVLQQVDPNGVVTAYTYDARQRLTSATTAGQTTLYAYWPTGLIRRITNADQSWLQYDHDDAQRLVRVSDNLGNSITYTLDSSGQRMAEEVKDISGVLRRQLSRSFDALGRVQQVTGRE